MRCASGDAAFCQSQARRLSPTRVSNWLGFILVRDAVAALLEVKLLWEMFSVNLDGEYRAGQGRVCKTKL